MSGKQTIIRVQHGKDNPYFMCRRDTAQDSRLSFEARGVLLYLLSKPDDWEVNRTDLMREGSCGRDRVDRILKELNEFGYLHREQPHVEAGKFGTIFYTVFEKPQPLTENPVTVKPVTVKPVTENPQHTEYRLAQKTETTSNGSSSDEPLRDGSGEPRTEAPFEIGQSVVWARESQKGYGYIQYIPCAVAKVNAKTLALDCPSKHGGTVRRNVKPANVYATEDEARARAAGWDTLEDLQPLQRTIAEYSFGLKPSQGISPDIAKRISVVVHEIRGRFQDGDSVAAEELRAAYGWYKSTSNAFMPSDGAKVATMVQRYRDATGAGRAARVEVHFPAPVSGCRVCDGTGVLVGSGGASVPCPACLEAEAAHERQAAS